MLTSVSNQSVFQLSWILHGHLHVFPVSICLIALVNLMSDLTLFTFSGNENSVFDIYKTLSLSI